MLSTEPTARARRVLAAAQAHYEAGLLDDASALLAAADARSVGELQGGRADRLRGQIAFATQPGSHATTLLVKAARELEAVDVELARDTYLEALYAAMIAGRLAGNVGVVEVSRAALAGPAARESPRPSDLLLDGWATRFAEGYAAGAPILKRAVSAFQRNTLSLDQERWLWLAARSAGDLWDDQTWTSAIPQST